MEYESEKMTLIKYILDFDLASAHIHDNLDQTNLFSTGVLQHVNLNQGSFFTLLPENANLSQVYKFRYGGILEQNPIEDHIIDSRKSFYSWIPNIRSELMHFMQNEIANCSNLSYLFDDCSSKVEEVTGFDLFDCYGYHIQDEVYYAINNKNSSVDLIENCLMHSSALWHSLCVFTKADLTKMNRLLTKDNLKEICEKTELFMVWAYDSEGYVFWEKKGRSFFEYICKKKELKRYDINCFDEKYTWEGDGPPVNHKRSWVRGKKAEGTQEILYPNLSHPPPVGIHWDYKNSSGEEARLFLGGSSKEENKN